MAMPHNIVYIRHGNSEANLIHEAERSGELHPAHDAVYDRSDWAHRLSTLGVEQAGITKQWLIDNGLAVSSFDRRYVSPFMRTRETAVLLDDADSEWYVDDRIKEQDWGVYGATPAEERLDKFPFAVSERDKNYWYSRRTDGESLSDDVYGRVRDWQGSLHRECADKSVLVVAHGELIMVARYINELLLPEDAQRLYETREEEVRNCSIVQHSRVNPDNPDDISKRIEWMRIVYPDNPDQSPFGGDWRRINQSKTRSSTELLVSLAVHAPLTR